MKFVQPTNKPEVVESNLGFHVRKLNCRSRPEDPRRNLVIPCFGEFGCEVVGTLYCIPRLAQKFPGLYKTAVVWYGREFLYRSLVDEVWELREEHMHLREHARAFHHDSKTLRRVEAELTRHGHVVSANYFAKLVVASQCLSCERFWKAYKKSACPYCGVKRVRHSVFAGLPEVKDEAVLPPAPGEQAGEFARAFLPENAVGIFARARKTYGRNLDVSYYKKLIDILRNSSYNPVWLGERSTVLPCPVPDVPDLTVMPEARDLEMTLAVVSGCRFTLQYWTASTRLAALTGTPYLLFESPDQIYGAGQEGYRLELVTRGRKKLVLAHFLNVLANHDAALDLTVRAIGEMEQGDYEDIIGLVDDPRIVEIQRHNFRSGLLCTT